MWEKNLVTNYRINNSDQLNSVNTNFPEEKKRLGGKCIKF